MPPSLSYRGLLIGLAFINFLAAYVVEVSFNYSLCNTLLYDIIVCSYIVTVSL